MVWRPARAWTSQLPVAGYRRFEPITGGVGRSGGSSWPCWLRRIVAVLWSEPGIQPLEQRLAVHSGER